MTRSIDAKLRRAAAILAAALLATACGGSGGDATDVPGTETVSDRADASDGVENDRRSEGAPRGVVLFVVDTLRADRFGVSGYDRATSPTIDALAARGTRWTHNFAQGGWTVPSMLSMLTGLAIGEESEAMPARQPTLAELLSESGVETAAFVGNAILTRTRGFERGFDHFDYPLDPKGSDAAIDTRTHEWVERFEAWHAGRTDDARPWFAWIHVFDPHAPYEATKRFDRFRTAPSEVEADVLQPRWIASQPSVRSLQPDGFEGLAPEFAVRRMLLDRAAYDAEVLETDAGVARLVAYLEAHAGGFDDVLLVIASDHGEMLYEYPAYRASHDHRVRKDGGLKRGLADYFATGHTGMLYDEVWRTPLVMVGPGIESGRVESRLSANLDIAPTVLDAFGIEPDTPLQGRSKLGGADPHEFVFGISGSLTAVRTADGRHLVELDRRLEERDAKGMTARLYLDPRPARATDRAAARPSDVRELRRAIADWRPTARLETNDAVDTSGERRILESLGYMDTGVDGPKVDD